jgi:hypothetical protein
MAVARNALVPTGALVGFWVLAGAAHALTTVTIDKCLSAQIKIVGKGAAATTGCYAKAAAKGLAVDAECLAKAAAKIGPALDELEDKEEVCLLEGMSATRTSSNASFGANIAATVGAAAGKCDAAKTKLVGKYVAARAKCHAKAAAKTGTIDAACLTKVIDTLAAGVSKAETKGDCSHLGQAVQLRDDASSFADAEICALDTACVPCGNGANDPGEACDISAPPSGWAACGSAFTCTACNCACPTTLVLTGDAAAPESALDLGWTGIRHREPIVSNDDLTVTLTNCAGTNRPCGTCDVSGPIANPDAGAGQLDSRRCSTDSSKKCTSDAVCTARTCLGGTNDGAACSNDSECPSGSCPAAGVCGFYLGSNVPISSGGVTTCMVNQVAGPVTGTFNVESGEMRTVAPVTTLLFLGILIDSPCPRCSDAGGINDGVNGGTCDGGPRVGLLATPTRRSLVGPTSDGRASTARPSKARSLRPCRSISRARPIRS